VGGRGRLGGWRRRRPRPRFRHVVEIASGILIANVGDVANIFISAYLAWALTRYPVILALLPGLASIRGGVMSSMAARLSTALQLGTLKPRLIEALEAEAAGVITATLLGTVMVALAASLASGLGFPECLSAAGISSAVVLLAMLPFAAAIAVFIYRRGVNPDNVAAPVLTVVGDIITLPSLAAAVVLLEPYGPRLEAAASLLVLWAAATTLFYSILGGGRLARVVRDSAIALALLGLLESGAGSVLARWRVVLYSAGLIHVVGSLLEDAGAAAAVVSSRSSTILHLYGPSRLAPALASMVIEAVLGALPGLAILSGIGYMSASLAGIPASPGNLLAALVGGGSILVAVGSVAGAGIAWLAYRLQLDPDSIAIPVVTSLVDLTGTIIVAAIALELAQPLG